MNQPLQITKWVTIPSRGLDLPLAQYKRAIPAADLSRAAEHDLPHDGDGIDWPWVTVEDLRAMTGDDAAGYYYLTH